MNCLAGELPLSRPARWRSLSLAGCAWLSFCLGGNFPTQAGYDPNHLEAPANPTGLDLAISGATPDPGEQACLVLRNTTNTLLYSLRSYPRLGEVPCTSWPSECFLWGSPGTNVTVTNIAMGQRASLFFWAQAIGPTNGQVLLTLKDGCTNLAAVVNGVTNRYNAFASTLVLLPGPVQTLNLGYDHGDGGSTQSPDFPPQNVVEVHGLYDGLTTFCASHNPLRSLDVHGLAGVQDIECYQCPNLTQVNVTNCPSLTRACFEQCQIQGVLDFTGDVNLQDIRGAVNRYTNIIFGGAGPRIWHLCVRDNPQICQNLVLTNFSSLQEWFMWNCNQTGAVNSAMMPSTRLTGVLLQDNRYESANLSGQAALSYLNLGNNRLTNLLVQGCQRLTSLDAHGNQLPTAVLDAILIELKRIGNTYGQLNLSANPQRPSSAGYSAADYLRNSLHWSVVLD